MQDEEHIMLKSVSGYDGLYSVSSDGQVFSIRTNQYLKPSVGNDGYYKVVFSVKNHRKTFRINRLVAEAFVDNPYKLPVVNHIDGNKKNNKFQNLEWVTVQQNAQHASKHNLLKGRTGETNPTSKLTESDVRHIREIYVRRSKTHGANALSKVYGVSNSIILKCVYRKTWKTVI